MIKKLKQKIYNSLRWSEKYTKTDMVYLAKGGFWLTLGQIFASASAFLLAIAYANFLPQEVYGTYKYILSIAGILGAFTLAGLGPAIVQSVARGFEGILKSAFWVNLKWSVFMILASFLGALYYFINDNYTLGISLIIIALFSPLTQSAALYGAFLNGKKEFKITVSYGIFITIINAILLAITVIITNNPILIILVYFTSNALLTLFFYIRTIKKFKPNKKIDKKTISYGKHLSLINILGTIAGHLDKILIFHYLGAIQLAIYSFAIALPMQLTLIKKIIRTLVLPKLVGQKIEYIQKNIPKKIIKFFIFLIPVVLVYIIAAPYIYSYLFPQYIKSVYYSQVFSLIILSFPTLFFNQVFTAHSKKKELYIINIVSSILQILLFILLIPVYKIWGIIASILITRFFIFGLSAILFKKIN